MKCSLKYAMQNVWYFTCIYNVDGHGPRISQPLKDSVILLIKSNNVSTQTDESLTVKDIVFCCRQQSFMRNASKILKLVFVSRHIILAYFQTIQKRYMYMFNLNVVFRKYFRHCFTEKNTHVILVNFLKTSRKTDLRQLFLVCMLWKKIMRITQKQLWICNIL